MSRFQEKHPLNPFTNRGVITNPDEFFGREQEIGEIVSRFRISSLADDARLYEIRPFSPRTMLQAMIRDLEAFRTAIAQTPIGADFYPIAERWLEMVKAEE